MFQGKPVAFDIRWRPFFLDATLPKTGVDKMTMYVQKMGGEARVKQMLGAMAKVGAKEGIAFDYGGLVANTLASHRLGEWAYARGGAPAQEKVVEAIMIDYFEKTQNIGDVNVLARAAARTGVATEEEARAFLADETAEPTAATVEKDVEAFRLKFKITGVPFYVINGKFTVSGAQEAEAFVEIFDDLINE